MTGDGQGHREPAASDAVCGAVGLRKTHVESRGSTRVTVLQSEEHGQGFWFTQLAIGVASVSTSTFHVVQKLARRMPTWGNKSTKWIYRARCASRSPWHQERSGKRAGDEKSETARLDEPAKSAIPISRALPASRTRLFRLSRRSCYSCTSRGPAPRGLTLPSAFCSMSVSDWFHSVSDYLAHMALPPPPWASVIVPIKDERDNLVPLTEQLIKALESCDESRSALFEILFIDDGSTDGSSEILNRLAADDPRVRVFHFDRHYGQSSAIDAGFKHSVGALVITIDGDLQNDPADISTLLPHVTTFDLVCGWRAHRHDSLVRMWSSRIANAIRSAVTGDRVHDTGCSLKIFRRTVVDRLQLFNGMHRFFPALALMHGFTIIEVPVRHSPRTHGRSKYGVGNRLFKGLYDLIAVRWMYTRVLRYRFRD